MLRSTIERKSLWRLVLLATCMTLTGCKQALVPVSGQVRLESGAALTTGDVALYAEDRPQAGREIPRGKITPEGTYSVATDGQPGALPGRYRVVVIAQEIVTERPTPGSGVWATRKLIDAKFFDAKQTPLIVDVVEGAPAGTFDLTVTRSEPRQ